MQNFIMDVTPQSELDKLVAPRETIFMSRERGAGRPTKRERREIDFLMDGLSMQDFDSDFDDNDDEE